MALQEQSTAPSPLRRAAWLGVLVAGVLAYLVVLRVMVDTRNLTFFPSLLLLGSATVPLAVLVFAESGGRSIPVRAWVVVATAVAGGVVGTVTAGVLEYRALLELGPASVLLVGVIEEAAKLVVPLVVLLLTRPRDARGGIVVGIASGTGFAVLETMGYGFQALLSAGSVAAVDQTLQLRALLSPAGHVAWTGFVVAALWRTTASPSRGRAVAGFAGAFALAVVLHTVWDLGTSLTVHVAVVVVSVVLLLVLVHRAHVRPQLRAARLSAPALR
ncbi:PrsW family glutamic-type intramembrane protease [Kineococcus indalonis]|uniref:PrsW family glutamic-type intramembrane protease n=1 Tax=Kineococcus indalonis TaxID=2696566 RepID=UPI002B1BDCE0|nr:PrsW family glutamic-type intramembrane protease [Kineococcus indalonis]